MFFNPFRILGDVSHTLSKCILIFAIHRNHSTEGVSLITQALYCLVFISRYLDLFHKGALLWNTVLKVFYILSSLYILFLMMRVYARTREREKAWKFGAACLVGSTVLAPILMLIFRHKKGDSRSWSFSEASWMFSIALESTCILPQLLLLRQTTVPTVIDSYYLLTLGSYRAFYILNWIWRSWDPEDQKVDPVSVIFGIVQTAFYIDFAWVYYSRQRVKLRNGGLVDSDDMRSSWLLRTIFGNKHVIGSVDEDEESAPALGRHNDRPSAGRTTSNSKWGSRGISVSADDGVLEGERARQRDFEDQEDGIVDSGLGEDNDNDPDAKMKDPDELARILDDDSDDGSDDGILKPSGTGVGNGAEWREGGSSK